MKSILYGLGLSIQFFTVIPIKLNIPMNRKSMTAMYGLYPFIGLLIGIISFAVVTGLHTLQFSPLFISILYILSCIVLTGGLHLDGWVDVSDAFFSYGEKEKRHLILEDPRTGAFGVISVISLLLLKLAVVYELIIREPANFYFIAIIPVIARIAVVYFFTITPTMKEKGIAYYFKTNVSIRALKITMLALVLLIGIVSFIFKAIILIIALFGAWLCCILLKRFALKHFGGMNGDILGSLCEGMEVIVWIIMLFAFI